jgi:hypothetical protein
MLDHHRALIYTMVIVSAAERSLPESELHAFSEIVGHLPCFNGFDRGALPALLNDCIDLMSREDGLNATLAAIRKDLPPKLRDTAYAIACDLVAINGSATQEELRVLELLRDRLDIDRLTAAAIERGARARYQRL